MSADTTIGSNFVGEEVKAGRRRLCENLATVQNLEVVFRRKTYALAVSFIHRISTDSVEIPRVKILSKSRELSGF